MPCPSFARLGHFLLLGNPPRVKSVGRLTLADGTTGAARRVCASVRGCERFTVPSSGGDHAVRALDMGVETIQDNEAKTVVHLGAHASLEGANESSARHSPRTVGRTAALGGVDVAVRHDVA